MNEPFHPGEIAVQERAGVRELARRSGRGIAAAIPLPAQAFLAQQPFAVLGGPDTRGRVWATALAGPPGFMRALDSRTIHISAHPPDGDPLAGTLAHDGDVGMLVIDFATRRRMRINGHAEPAVPAEPVAPAVPGKSSGAGAFLLHTREVFANCPKYIQSREWIAAERTAIDAAPVASTRATELLPDHVQWIRRADTFFIATVHREAGADVSHRGGSPGFIRVLNPRTIVWPDYAGNNMFQTLGNLAADPRAGLLFLDLDHGAVLQLSGEARVNWDPAAAREFPGAHRLVEFSVREVLERPAVLALRWLAPGSSPYLP